MVDFHIRQDSQATASSTRAVERDMAGFPTARQGSGAENSVIPVNIAEYKID